MPLVLFFFLFFSFWFPSNVYVGNNVSLGVQAMRNVPPLNNDYLHVYLNNKNSLSTKPYSPRPYPSRESLQPIAPPR